MLIKLYTRGAVEHLHIIEDITKVKITRSLQHGILSNKSTKPDIADLSESYEHLDMTGEGFVLIEYEKEGDPCAVRVYNKAYVCSDDGKTIEPVFTSQFFKESERSMNTEQSK